MAKNKEDKISIKRLISNTAFMIKYAAKYDKPLIIKIFLMNLILKAAMSLNGTFILKMIIISIQSLNFLALGVITKEMKVESSV